MVCLPDNSILARIMLICKSWQDALREMLVLGYSHAVTAFEHCVQASPSNVRASDLWVLTVLGVHLACAQRCYACLLYVIYNACLCTCHVYIRVRMRVCAHVRGGQVSLHSSARLTNLKIEVAIVSTIQTIMCCSN